MHTKISVNVLRDIVHILWQGFLSFVHIVRFYSTRLNVVLFTTVSKKGPFLRRFSRNS
jgi:hypothetical protein